MKDWLQDEDGVIWKNGDLVLDGEIDGIAQQCEIRISTNKGEWWIDQAQGLPWTAGIMGQKLDPGLVGKMILTEGMNTEGVTNIAITKAVQVGGETTVLFNVQASAESKDLSI